MQQFSRRGSTRWLEYDAHRQCEAVYSATGSVWPRVRHVKLVPIHQDALAWLDLEAVEREAARR